MKRALSVDNVLNAKFTELDFEGKWLDAIGKPELTGTWFVQGDIKSGKTSFTLQLTKYMTRFSRVVYNSVEEGLSKTIREAYKREQMHEVRGKFELLDIESYDDLVKRLRKHKSANIVVIDTIQFWELTFSQYKNLKKMFRKKLFIYMSHRDGGRPAGATAQKIWRDANVAWMIEGFKAFPVSRYGGGEAVTINEERADAYWGLKLKNNQK